MGLSGGDVVLVQYRGTQFGQRVFNNMIYKVNGPASENTVIQDLTQLLQQFTGAGVPANGRKTTWLQMLPPSYTLDEVRAQRINAPRSVLVDSVQGAPGTNPGAAGTANLAVTVTKRTDFGGRRFVSSTHIGGLPSVVALQGIVDPAYRAVVSAWATQMLLPITIAVGGLTYIWAIYHKNFMPNTDEIKTFVVQDTVRVMRRRTVRVGI